MRGFLGFTTHSVIDFSQRRKFLAILNLVLLFFVFKVLNLALEYFRLQLRVQLLIKFSFDLPEALIVVDFLDELSEHVPGLINVFIHTLYLRL